MKPLGFFREMMEFDAPEFPEAGASEGALPVELVPMVVAYLQRGTGFFDVMGATADPISPGRSISGGASLLTDGTWVWRLDLPHYVLAFRMALPDEFIERAFQAVRTQTFPDITVDESLAKRGLAAAGWG